MLEWQVSAMQSTHYSDGQLCAGHAQWTDSVGKLAIRHVVRVQWIGRHVAHGVISLVVFGWTTTSIVKRLVIDSTSCCWRKSWILDY